MPVPDDEVLLLWALQALALLPPDMRPTAEDQLDVAAQLMAAIRPDLFVE